MVTAWRNKEISVIVKRTLAKPGREVASCAPEVRRFFIVIEVGVEEAEVDGMGVRGDLAGLCGCLSRNVHHDSVYAPPPMVVGR